MYSSLQKLNENNNRSGGKASPLLNGGLPSGGGGRPQNPAADEATPAEETKVGVATPAMAGSGDEDNGDRSGGGGGDSGTTGKRLDRRRRRRRRRRPHQGTDDSDDEDPPDDSEDDEDGGRGVGGEGGVGGREHEMEYCDPCYCYGKCCLDIVASIFCVSLL